MPRHVVKVLAAEICKLQSSNCNLSFFRKKKILYRYRENTKLQIQFKHSKMKVILTPVAVAPPATSPLFKFSDGRFFLSVYPHSPPPHLHSRFAAKQFNNPKLVFVSRAADSTQPSTLSTSPDKPTVPDDEFSLAKVSFGVIGLGLGVSLLSYGFGAYFNILPGSEWSAIMLTYGFPLAIIGMALKYAELKPVPCLTYADAQVLRETSATPILKQVRSDVTRYRYGDEQHLEEALKRIFQYGLGGGIPRRSAPILQRIREEVTEDGKYCLVLIFEAKALELSDFEKRKAKFASFFGPDITAEIGEVENNLYEVRLISNLNASASPS